jgi:hypothetical protein
VNTLPPAPKEGSFPVTGWHPPTWVCPAGRQHLPRILAERKGRTRLGLSKYAAEAAEQAASHRDKLGIAGKVKDVASVHSTLWPEGPKTNEILPGSGILIGTMNVIDASTGEVDSGPDKGKFIDLETGEIVSEQREEKRKELPSSGPGPEE